MSHSRTKAQRAGAAKENRENTRKIEYFEASDIFRTKFGTPSEAGDIRTDFGISQKKIPDRKPMTLSPASIKDIRGSCPVVGEAMRLFCQVCACVCACVCYH